MAGIKFPVIEYEKLMIKQGGRGLYMYSGGTTTNCASAPGSWSKFFANASGTTAGTILPTASAAAWFKWNLDGTTYYTPGFTNLSGL